MSRDPKPMVSLASLDDLDTIVELDRLAEAETAERRPSLSPWYEVTEDASPTSPPGVTVEFTMRALRAAIKASAALNKLSLPVLNCGLMTVTSDTVRILSTDLERMVDYGFTPDEARVTWPLDESAAIEVIIPLAALHKLLDHLSPKMLVRLELTGELHSAVPPMPGERAAKHALTPRYRLTVEIAGVRHDFGLTYPVDEYPQIGRDATLDRPADAVTPTGSWEDARLTGVIGAIDAREFASAARILERCALRDASRPVFNQVCIQRVPGAAGAPDGVELVTGDTFRLAIYRPHLEPVQPGGQVGVWRERLSDVTYHPLEHALVSAKLLGRTAGALSPAEPVRLTLEWSFLRIEQGALPGGASRLRVRLLRADGQMRFPSYQYVARSLTPNVRVEVNRSHLEAALNQAARGPVFRLSWEIGDERRALASAHEPLETDIQASFPRRDDDEQITTATLAGQITRLRDDAPYRGELLFNAIYLAQTNETLAPPWLGWQSGSGLLTIECKEAPASEQRNLVTRAYVAARDGGDDDALAPLDAYGFLTTATAGVDRPSVDSVDAAPSSAESAEETPAARVEPDIEPNARAWEHASLVHLVMQMGKF